MAKKWIDTLNGKLWKTHPEIFLKFSFSGSSHMRYYWKSHPIVNFRILGHDTGRFLENSSKIEHYSKNDIQRIPGVTQTDLWKTYPNMGCGLKESGLKVFPIFRYGRVFQKSVQLVPRKSKFRKNNRMSFPEIHLCHTTEN